MHDLNEGTERTDNSQCNNIVKQILVENKENADYFLKCKFLPCPCVGHNVNKHAIMTQKMQSKLLAKETQQTFILTL